ncbi:MAG: hypothetical protein M3O90_06720 [Actinomycetota bacterium]|nr:hypothetical protein [Actinomycetota bacterium]
MEPVLASSTGYCEIFPFEDVAALIVAAPLWLLGLFGIAWFVQVRLERFGVPARIAVGMTAAAAWTAMAVAGYLALFSGPCHILGGNI